MKGFLTALGVFAAWSTGRAASVPPRLLEPAAVTAPALARGASGPLEAGGGYRVSAAFRAGSSRPGDRWRLPLSTSDEDTAVLVIEDRGVSGPGRTGLRGRLEGEPGSMVWLAVREGALAGSVLRESGRAYRLQPGPGGRLAVEPVEGRDGPRCANGQADGAEPSDPNPDGDPRRGLRLAEPGRSAAAPVVIDLALVYTRAAVAGAGSEAAVGALWDLGILEANDAFRRSGASLELRSVLEAPVDYQESGDLATDLLRLSQAGDGWLDEVLLWRDRHAADLVCLMVESENSNQFAGMANQLRSTSPSALAGGFCVCLRPYLIGNYTLPHEVGHLLGCNHDRENAGGGGLEPWSYGTRIQVDGEPYRTVMAYRPGLQFPHFSNPDVAFRGVPTGVASGAQAANNVRTLNLTSPLIARVREPSRRVGFVSSRVEGYESAGRLVLRWERAGAGAVGEAFTVEAVPGSAVEGIDFRPLRMTVVPEPDQTEGECALELIDNQAFDGPRRLSVRLVNPVEGLSLGPISVVEVVVRDDEVDGAAVLDSGFRPTPGADHAVHALAWTSEGRLLAAGDFTSFNGAPHGRIVRVEASGTADASFQAEVKYRAQAVVGLPDGRVALAGEFNTVNGRRCNHVAVLEADGSIDPSFSFETGADLAVNALAALPEGGLVIGGTFTSVEGRAALRVARLRLNGSVDPDFDTRQGPDGEVLALALAAEGKVVVGGRFRNVGGRRAAGIARLLPNGALDPEFRSDPGVDGVVSAVAIDPEGRVVVAGDFTTAQGHAAPRVARLTASGAWDETFGPGAGPDDAVAALALAADGALWIGGAFLEVDGRPRARVARLLPDGALDESWQPGPGPNDRVLTLALAPDGRLAIGGLFTEVLGVPRGGVALLLPGSARAAELRVAGRGLATGGLGWSAWMEPMQTYELEGSGDLRSWQAIETLRPSGGAAEGEWRGAEETAGFLRLRRRLE